MVASTSLLGYVDHSEVAARKATLKAISGLLATRQAESGSRGQEGGSIKAAITEAGWGGEQAALSRS